MDDVKPVQIQLYNFGRNSIPIRNLMAEHITKLVAVPGIVITASKVKNIKYIHALNCLFYVDELLFSGRL